MPTLHTALQEGFADDEVILRIDGREVFHKTGVKTRLQIGLAATHEEPVNSGPVSVEVELPARKLTRTLPMVVTEDLFLGVSLEPVGTLRHVVSREPFGYV